MDDEAKPAVMRAVLGKGPPRVSSMRTFMKVHRHTAMEQDVALVYFRRREEGGGEDNLARSRRNGRPGEITGPLHRVG